MKFLPLAALLAALLPAMATAHDGVEILDPYARVIAGSGVVYFMINNHQDSDDTLIAAKSDIATTMLMNSTADANGVMQMRMVMDGFSVSAYGTRLLTNAGDHVMLSDLTANPKPGETLTLTLTFAKAGDVMVTVPVDNARRTDPGMGPTEYDARSGHHAAHDAADHNAAAPDAATHDAAAHDAHAAMGHTAPDAAAHDAHAAMGHNAHANHSSGLMSQPTGTDEQVITQIMMAMFDKPEAPLTVNPVVVMGDDAVASWAQGDQAGRALLARRDGAWTIVLCGGPDLRQAGFLAANGVQGAEHLSAMFNAAEDKLGADLVARFSTFEGVVMISEPAHN